MTLRFDRGVSPAVVLALLGGVLALVAMLLPWYSLDEAATKELLQSITAMLGESGVLGDRRGEEMAAVIDVGMPEIMAALKEELVGYKAFSAVSVGFHALAAGGAIFAGLKLWSGEGTAQQQRGELLGAALLVAVRPVIALVRDPAKGGDIPGVTVPDNLFSPDIGLFVAFAGAALLLAAGLMVSQQDAQGASEWSGAPEPAGGPFVPGGAPRPAAAAAAAAAPAYASPAAPSYAASAAAPSFGQPAPSFYTPGGAYGDEGPSTLDRDARLVRPNDPYAPKPLDAPAVPIMPAPIEVPPVSDPSPVVDAPGAVYGVPPRPAPVPQAPPARSGSTAPPGFS